MVHGRRFSVYRQEFNENAQFMAQSGKVGIHAFPCADLTWKSVDVVTLLAQGRFYTIRVFRERFFGSSNVDGCK